MGSAEKNSPFRAEMVTDEGKVILKTFGAIGARKSLNLRRTRMSKIIKLPNAKPITCACCGCVYEFESGDTVEVIYAEHFCADGTPTVISKRLNCPNCDFSNAIEFVKENCENE